MRLNKKLAALTMSVVMVASNTAPVTVFASGIQTEVQEAGIVGATEWTLAGEPEFIGDDATKTVKVKYTLTNNETGEPKEFEEEANKRGFETVHKENDLGLEGYFRFRKKEN